MRKIIQVSATGHENTNNTQGWVTLFALCDDGTVWTMQPYKRCETWLQMADIPQDDHNSDDAKKRTEQTP